MRRHVQTRQPPEHTHYLTVRSSRTEQPSTYRKVVLCEPSSSVFGYVAFQVFKHTSIFNVRSALANNAVLLAPPNAAGGPSGRADDARGGAAGAGASGDLYADADEITEMLSSGEGPDEYTGQGGLDSEWDYLRAFYSDEEHNGTGNKGGGGGGKGGQGGKSKATGAARKRDRWVASSRGLTHTHTHAQYTVQPRASCQCMRACECSYVYIV